jgi:hypothetical protein
MSSRYLSGVAYITLKVEIEQYPVLFKLYMYIQYMQYTVFEAYQIRIVKNCCASSLINVEIYYSSMIHIARKLILTLVMSLSYV